MTEPSLKSIARQIDPWQAQLAVAQAMATMGSLAEWDSETIEWVAEPIVTIGKDLSLPTFTSSDNDSALIFWQKVNGTYDPDEWDDDE